MFSKEFSCKSKKVLSAFMSLIMIFSMMFVLTLTAPVPASAAAATEDAILIGKGTSMPKTSSTYPMANIMLPIGAKGSGDVTWNDQEVCFKITFKCKMLSGTQPIVGMLRTNYQSGDSTYSEHTWSYNNDRGTTESHSGYPFTMSSYDSATGTFTAIVRAWYNETNYYRNGRWCYITIGNAEHNAAWYEARDLDASFIMSQPEIYACDQSGNTYGDNLAPAFNASGCDFNGTYFLRSSGAAQYDSPYYASAGKWHIDSAPALVNRIKVPTDYNTSSNYNSGNFTYHAASGTTREYYTNSNYSDLYFDKVKYSNDSGFKVITNLNKQMIVIDANHNGEADNRTTDGYQPVLNRHANIFLPINFGQYSMNGAATVDGNFLVKVSMTAVRLEGDGYPVLGRIVGKKSVGSGGGSQAFGKMAKNLHLSGYYGDSSHEQYSGGAYSYNETTGAFAGWMRVRISDNDYATKWGNNEVITIGNAEHVWQEGTYDTTEFNTSFAISDVKVDIYKCSSSPYTVGDLVATDVAPGLYAENIDVDTPWTYQYTGSGSNHDKDLIRGNQYLWEADGNAGMVHRKNLTTCMKNNHVADMTHHAATSTTREYWGCAKCKTTYADPWGVEEITDLTAKKMLVNMPAANGPESIFYPISLTDFENHQWYKFTCKVECYGDAAPVVTTLYGDYGGNNQCNTTSSGGDFGIQECTYDESTGILTAYLYGWVKDTINKSSRYPYERMNPISGANCAIIIGNGRYVGNGYTDTVYTSGFAITDPVLKKLNGATGAVGTLSDAKTCSVTGDNLLAPITDKTVDFDSEYVATWTNANNPLAAPVGKWYKTGSNKAGITLQDVPVPPTQTGPKMLKIAGYNSSSSAQAIMHDTVLESSTTYQFDMDCRAFGGTYIPRIIVQDKIEGGSFTTVSGGDLDESFNGYHYTLQFTTRANLASGNNFRLQIGLSWNARNMSSMYIANVQVCKVLGSATFGENVLQNGDFSYSEIGAVTDDNKATQMIYWTGLGNLTKHYDVRIMAIPTGFFDSGSTITGRDDIAIKVDNNNWTELQFKAELAPDKYYRFSFNYRDMDSMPDLEFNTANVTATKISSASGGRFTMTYEIYSNSSNVRFSDKDPNTRFRFRFKDKFDRTLYINHVELYELDGTGGNTVGVNLMGNLNAVYDDSVYSELVNDKDTISVTLNQAGDTSVSRDLLNGWLGSNYFGDETVQLIKVPSDFFNYKTPQQRLSLIRKTLLGAAESDGFDPAYNPNGDSVWGDVFDLVHAKNRAVADNG